MNTTLWGRQRMHLLQIFELHNNQYEWTNFTPICQTINQYAWKKETTGNKSSRSEISKDKLWLSYNSQQITEREMKNQQKQKPKHLTYDTKPESKRWSEMLTSTGAKKLMKFTKNLPNST